MTDEEIRRIRRIVTGDLPALPPRPVDPRHEERFRRALGSQRRASASSTPTGEVEAASPMTRPIETPQPSSRTPSRASSASTSASTAQAGSRPTRSTPSPQLAQSTATAAAMFARSLVRSLAAAPAGPSADPSTSGLDDAQAQEALAPSSVVVPPPMPIPAVTEVPTPDGWAHGIADTVSALCQGSEPSFHSWTIQVPLDSEALPHTQLRMTFSRHHLLLRFSTESTRSFHLVSAHQSQLRALLVRALPGDRHIDIELT